VLHDVNLTLKRGTVTALVGRSGAGKSTVAALLSRFYVPQQGEILLDGRDAATFTRGEWARAIAMVSQVCAGGLLRAAGQLVRARGRGRQPLLGRSMAAAPRAAPARAS
jgi:ABC-type cobalamin/Fe3+-siderophores transport system ATPase subunit